MLLYGDLFLVNRIIHFLETYGRGVYYMTMLRRKPNIHTEPLSKRVSMSHCHGVHLHSQAR